MLFSFGVFLTPIAEAFDTTTGPVAPLLSGSVLTYYAAGAAGGWASDRFGIRPVVGLGAVCLSAGLALTARAGALWVAYVAYVPLVGVGVGCCYAPLIGTVGRWFDRPETPCRRSSNSRKGVAAMGLLLVGVGAGTLVMPVLSRRLIDDQGWRSTYELFALASLFVIGSAAVVAVERVPAREPTSFPAAVLFRSGRMRLLYLSVIVLAPGFYAPLAFLNDYAVDRSVATTSAALLLATLGAASLVARLAFGLVGGRFAPLALYRLGYWLLASSLAIWLAAGSSYGLMAAAAAVHGIGWAAWVTATPVVLAAWYGTTNLGGVVGVFYTGLGFGAVAGPAVSGFVVDRFGYRPAIAATLLTSVCAVGLVSLVGSGESGGAADP